MKKIAHESCIYFRKYFWWGIPLVLIVTAGYSCNRQIRDEKLITAATDGDLAMVKNLLAEGVDINFRFETGDTALMFAVANNRTDTVKFLLERGARRELQNSDGLTASNYVYFSTSEEIRKALGVSLEKRAENSSRVGMNPE